MKTQLLRLLARWAVNSFGVWLVAELLAEVTLRDGLTPVIVSGLVLALVNAIIKPAVILLSLPVVLLSLGLFMLVINGLMFALAAWLYSGLSVDGFVAAVLAGLAIGLVNYLVTIGLEGWRKKTNE